MSDTMDFENNSDSDYEYQSIEECQTDCEDEFDEIIPLQDDAKFVLKGHSNVVLSVICDSKNELIFTGGMDDKIIVWNIENGEQLCVLEEHLDSVTNLSLDNSDTFLVSGDLRGLVVVWKISRNPFKIEKFKSIELNEIIDIVWHFSSVTNEEYLYICDITGTAQSFTYESIADENSAEMCCLFYSQGKGCCCNGFDIILEGKYAAVLYGGTCGSHEECSNTNELFLCDVNTYNSTKVNLKAVANEEEDNDEGLGAGFTCRKINNAHMVAIGDWSQVILASVVDTGVGNLTCKLNRVPVKDGGLVTNVAFCDSLPYLAFASKQGVLGVYDVAAGRMRHLWHYEAVIAPQMPSNGNVDDHDEPQDHMAVTQLRWRPGTSVFITAGLDGRLCSWDARAANNSDVQSWWGHSGIIWGMCIAKNGTSLVTVSEDQSGRLFNI